MVSARRIYDTEPTTTEIDDDPLGFEHEPLHADLHLIDARHIGRGAFSHPMEMS